MLLTRRSFLSQAGGAVSAAGLWSQVAALADDPLSGTQPLTAEGDLAMKMVEGIGKYLDRELADAPNKRKALWKPDFSSPEAYTKSLEPHRERLRKIIGAVDERIKPVKMEMVAEPNSAPLVEGKPGAIARGENYTVYEVRWPVFEGVYGEGLLLQPDGEPKARVVAIPDADWTPEMLVGMVKGVPFQAQYPLNLARNKCQVIVQTLIDRSDNWSGNPTIGRMTNQPHREFVYRMSYQMGRHIVGYEAQKALAAVDWMATLNPKDGSPICICGVGEGGLLAMLSAALDKRIELAWVEGYVGPGYDTWNEPIYRNVWSICKDYGLGEMALLAPIVPSTFNFPSLTGPPSPRQGRSGAAPGKLTPPHVSQIGERVMEELKRVGPDLARFGPGSPVGIDRQKTDTLIGLMHVTEKSDPPVDLRKSFDPSIRQKRQFDQLVEHTQKLVRESESVRKKFFWDKLTLLAKDTGGPAPIARKEHLEAYEKSIEPLRAYFWEEVIGKLPAPTIPMNPRTRLLHETSKWKSYEVTLDLYPDVYSNGILTVPKEQASGGRKPLGAEKRPVVVCQHGLEGRPSDVINPKEKTRYYNSFGSALADRGFVVFAPQNPYIGQNTFRQLQRKANPLKLSLFSFIVRQHERILDWLGTLPFVDPQRIGFYGLSYGGKTAMRVPAILKGYCLSICSGDFNEWIWKNARIDWAGSYMFTGEYEMFEFDLGNTFSYAEMAALIAPRPFMVERGHDDGVGIDEWVAYEYAKVRRLYAKLGIPERTEIEFFKGGHEINGKGTFAFLHRHLNWPDLSKQ